MILYDYPTAPNPMRVRLFIYEKKINIKSIRKKPFQISSDIIFHKNNLLLVSENKRIYKIN